MNFIIILGLSFQCMLDSMSYASSIHIDPGWEFVQSKPTSQKQLKKFLKELVRVNEDYIDPRFLALSWIESRIRPSVKRGDRGKACGMFQIHARYSHPLFRRERGFVGWVESEEKPTIKRECRKLENIRYSVNTMQRLLVMMDRKDLHPCHHNSGFYGKCNTWYKKRLNYWITYFEVANFMCNERIIDFMAMLRTGNPIPTAPANMMQGYLDAMEGKDPTSQDTTYKSGYDLAKLVLEGKAQPPAWAKESNQSKETTSTLPSGEAEREG
jgi:hypothetical protein